MKENSNPPAPMRLLDKQPRVARRGFLKGSGLAAISVTVVPAASLALSPTNAFAEDFPALGAEVGSVLLHMARDIYPHDKLANKYYLKAISAHEKAAAKDAAFKKMINDGVADLNTRAKAQFSVNYVAVIKETDRVSLLKSIEQTPFFQKIRGDLVTGIYDNKEVWPQMGYEGSSWEKGGYINRGFNDIDWL